MTMAWPARTGSWALSLNGSEPEQTVKLTRDRRDYGCAGGTLTVYLAQPTATGDVAALSVDLTGCNTAQVRIGTTTRLAPCRCRGPPGSTSAA